jgi:hypothetical protein
MMFTFKRDANGVETIHVGDACVATLRNGRSLNWNWGLVVPGVHSGPIADAIERADEAGFWDWDHLRNNRPFIRNEVTVEVPSC